jgi:hypothetical protein
MLENSFASFSEGKVKFWCLKKFELLKYIYLPMESIFDESIISFIK